MAPKSKVKLKSKLKSKLSGITSIIQKLVQIVKFNKNAKSLEFIKYIKTSLDSRKYVFIKCSEFQIEKIKTLIMIAHIDLSLYKVYINERVQLPLRGIYINCNLKSRGLNVIVTKFKTTF